MCFSRTSVIHNVVIVTLQFLIRRGRLLILQPLTPDFIWTPSPHLLFLKKMPSVYCLFGPCLFRTGQSTPERNKGRSELTKFYLHIFVFKINFLIIDAPSPHTSKILKKSSNLGCLESSLWKVLNPSTDYQCSKEQSNRLSIIYPPPHLYSYMFPLLINIRGYARCLLPHA